MTVGQRIRKTRIDKGLTQEELAEKMGYSGKTSVSAAENRGDNITTTKVQRFADALDVSFHYLMGYEDEYGNPILSALPKPEDTTEAKLIREIYRIFTPEQLDDPDFVETIISLLKLTKTLDTQRLIHLLEFAQTTVS